MESVEGTESNSVETGWAVGIEHNLFVRVVYALIASLGITGNFLVCFVLIRIPALRNRASQLIVHLAITDLLTCVWVVPFHLFPSTPPAPHGIMGEIFCRVFVSKYPLWVTIITSIYSLIAVNLERFVAIVYPLYYRKMFTFRRIAYISLLCWVIGSVSSGWFFFNFDYDHRLKICTFVPFPPKVSIVIGLYIFTVIYLFPISFNTVAQYYMIKTLKQHATSMETRSETNGGT
ncbi:Neuropeptide SIFamide receptor [Holothuria leucospilota]|uniref:Neuropeptide SIFamide receptor n=1 Tax=Holothuria leucospilota TaxID=206669 RepID=A0A9Q1HFW7_HOLLE|nr:Neuropeptide SIFamide receptor [Holothuria leucospilota]